MHVPAEECKAGFGRVRYMGGASVNIAVMRLNMQALAISALWQSQYCHSTSAGLAKQQFEAGFTPVFVPVCFLLTVPKPSLDPWANQTPSNAQRIQTI